MDVNTFKVLYLILLIPFEFSWLCFYRLVFLSDSCLLITFLFSTKNLVTLFTPILLSPLLAHLLYFGISPSSPCTPSHRLFTLPTSALFWILSPLLLTAPPPPLPPTTHFWYDTLFEVVCITVSWLCCSSWHDQHESNVWHYDYSVSLVCFTPSLKQEYVYYSIYDYGKGKEIFFVTVFPGVTTNLKKYFHWQWDFG